MNTAGESKAAAASEFLRDADGGAFSKSHASKLNRDFDAEQTEFSGKRE
ncbi:MAG TPA: hypothetical protein VFC46_12560 [Humisphaera sp.]|nr:hypothetical protein [Humisphaera sp.]